MTQEERDRSMQLSVPSVLCSPDTHKDSQNWIGKRRGKEDIEVCLRPVSRCDPPGGCRPSRISGGL